MAKEKSDTKKNGKQNILASWFNLNRRNSLLFLAIVSVISILLGSQLTKLKLNYSLNSFFPQNDNELEYYEEFNEQFGQYNDFLFIVIKDEAPLSPLFLKRVSDLQKELKLMNEVEIITSPLDLRGLQINPFGINTFNLLNIEPPPTIEELNALDMYGNFFGKDARSILIFLRHREFNSKPTADLFYFNLQKLIQEAEFEDFLISGKIQMQYDFTQKLEKELGNLLITSIGVIILVLLVMFRSIKGLILPLLVLILTLVWIMGFMAWTGKPIDVMVIMIPAILLIVALSDVIHFIHKYDSLKSIHTSVESALSQTIMTTGKATFLTSATTAIGFLGLLFLPIEPIRLFGLYTAIGVLFAFIITFFTLPSLLYFFPKQVEKPTRFRFKWEDSLSSIYDSILLHRKVILFLILSTTLLIALGITRLELSTSLIVGLQKNEPELQKVAYFDEAFDGYRPLELGIELNAKTELISANILGKIAKIEAFIEKNYGGRHLQSPLNIVREINAGIYGGSRKHYELPEEDDLKKIERIYNSPRLKTQRSQVQSENGKLIRIIGRTKDLGSGKYHELNDSLTSFLNSDINDNSFKAKITGASYLIDRTDQYVVSSLIKGLGFALAAVSIFIFLSFRSWRLAFITLIPNILPIVIMFGLMGLLGIKLNISTAIIFTVALGIAIDDSIHFIARYKLENELHDNGIAIKNAFTGTGKSIIVTSLVIILGFAVFLISGFSAVYYLGFFIVAAALVALLLDLTLLPLFLKSKDVLKSKST